MPDVKTVEELRAQLADLKLDIKVPDLDRAEPFPNIYGVSKAGLARWSQLSQQLYGIQPMFLAQKRSEVVHANDHRIVAPIVPGTGWTPGAG